MKTRIFILVAVFLFISNLVTSTTVLAQEEWKPKEWKGEGTKIEFQSIPTITIKDFLNGKVPKKTKTIWGTLNFPADAADKNVPAVVIMHGGSGLSVHEEHWMSLKFLFWNFLFLTIYRLTESISSVLEKIFHRCHMGHRLIFFL